MKIVAFIPVKAHSERLDSKNTRVLCGKPLFLHNLEKLLECDLIDEVYLDSEDDHILNMYDYLPYKKFKRDASLATNLTDGNVLFYNECKNISADIYIQILATAPCLSSQTIRDAIELLLHNLDTIDSVVCARKERPYIWNETQPNYDLDNIPNSKDIPEVFAENMSLYVITREAALASKRRIGYRPKLIFVNRIESIDIDYEEDFALAEAVLMKKILAEKHHYDKMKHLLTSELLSDILDQLNIKNKTLQLKCNLPQCKIMGRAKTIRLKKIDQENYEEIYKTMDYYPYINCNNIICVENEAQDFAYFGELNALISISRGCLGTIVSGATRDIKEVSAMNYPVFYKNAKCNDVKYKAVLDYYDRPIQINHVTIMPDDLIFADCDGIIVLPKNQEKEILNQALKNYLLEKQITFDFANNQCINHYRF